VEITREHIVSTIGFVVALLLQIMVAPLITVFNTVPNFILVYCLVRALAMPTAAGYIMPFIGGLLFDLMGGGPVGSMALVLVLVSLLVSRLILVLNNDTLFVPLALLLMSIVVAELLYGLFVVAFGAELSLGEALLYRGLPCILYDGVVGLVMYPLGAWLMRPAAPAHPRTPVLR
jgi:rod shape-determining protein MreD